MKPMLALYGHPFSSYTQKVLTALHENGTPYELRNLDPGAPGDHAAEWRRRWPLAQFPLLVDGSRTVVESSIVIEHLQLAHPGPVQLIPAEPAAALEVRFMDRFFDLHVMAPVQHAVNAALTGNADRRAEGLAWAAGKLETAYAWLEGEWAGRILAARRGDRGFGYDPVFFSPAHGCSAAELPADIKNRDSHRGRALARLRELLG